MKRIILGFLILSGVFFLQSCATAEKPKDKEGLHGFGYHKSAQFYCDNIEI